MKKLLSLFSMLIILGLNLTAQGWTYATSTGTTFILYGMSFPPGQSDIGYACGMQYTYDADGVIVKTTDGGENWTQIFPTSGTIDGLQGIWFISDNVGFACGWNNYFIKTTDGGTTWTPISVAADVWYYTDVVFWDANNGVAAAYMNNPSSDQAIHITSDGGNTWVPATSGVATAEIMGVSYADQNTLFAVGTGGHVFKSTDGGHNWTTNNTLSAMLFGVDFANATFGVVGGEEKMFATNDGGATWTTYTTGYENFYGAKAFADGTGYIGGTDENIYITTDFGASWQMEFNGGGTSSLYRIRSTAAGGLIACGSQGGILINLPPFGANFMADNTNVCEGNVVNFTDLSTGNIVSWNWTFDGGTPATSTDQNPSVTYNTAGVYDVSLEVSDGTNTNTFSVPDMITVDPPAPAQPNTPVGATNICANDDQTYTTLSVAYAQTYYWEVLPTDAGSITGSDTSAVFTPSTSWTGTYTVKVRASSDCGYGPWSAELSCTLNFTPAPFTVSSGGGYCEGGQGLEVTLDGSETGVDYELFLDDVSTGTILPGTGSALSFGFQTDEGIYSVTAFTTDCSTEMYGGSYIYLVYPPAAANQPTGPETVCNNSISEYQTAAVAQADTMIWALDPAEAGSIMGGGEQISIAWSPDFTGMASLSVYAANDCGDGTASPALEIMVNATPQPEISGNELVCQDTEEDYFTTINPGATYNWEVAGGNITGGTATNAISVLWTTLGNGYVFVTETSTEGCEATSDTLNIVIDDCIGMVENLIDQVSVYPNPAYDYLYLAFEAEKDIDYTISIFNQLGQQVYSQKNRSAGGQETMQISLGNMPAGIYFVKLHAGAKIYYQGKMEKFN